MLSSGIILMRRFTATHFSTFFFGKGSALDALQRRLHAACPQVMMQVGYEVKFFRF